MTERSGSTIDIRIGPVTPANRALVTALQLAPEQVGFVASNADSLREAKTDRDARPRVVMIDRAWQGRGYGKAALREVLGEIRGLGHIRHVSICYEPENEAARQLYRAAGFVEQGLDEDGEMIADLALAASTGR